MATKTHLTIKDRQEIYFGLTRGLSFKQIAKIIGKDCTTVAREVKNHYTTERKGSLNSRFNDCRIKAKCPVIGGCKDQDCKRTKCSSCSKVCCTSKCKSYVQEKCDKLSKPPYVCNGCEDKPKCKLEKHVYCPVDAQQEYEKFLTCARNGIVISYEEAVSIGKALKQGFDNGQSIYHIVQAYGEDLINYSSKTLYKYVAGGVFPGIGNIDHPRQVRYKKRKRDDNQRVKVDKQCTVGRKYQDYKDYCEQNPDCPVVEMDTVIGKPTLDEKCLLTLHFVSSKLMLAILLPEHKASCVTEAINAIRQKLGADTFSELFKLILTDNGSEFSDPSSIEIDSETMQPTTKVFYCEPRQSQQKGACENNHELIRRIIPKGVSMNGYTQKDIDLMMSHVNSYIRADLGNKSPYEVFTFLNGDGILSKLGISFVSPKEVTLKPSLLNK